MPPALHDTELPSTIAWLVDSVITGGQLPPGDPVGVAVAVGVGVGVPPPAPQCDCSTVLVSPLTPSNPQTTYRSLPTAVPPVKECATFVFGPVLQLSFTVSYT